MVLLDIPGVCVCGVLIIFYQLQEFLSVPQVIIQVFWYSWFILFWLSNVLQIPGMSVFGSVSSYQIFGSLWKQSVCFKSLWGPGILLGKGDADENKMDK